MKMNKKDAHIYVCACARAIAKITVHFSEIGKKPNKSTIRAVWLHFSNGEKGGQIIFNKLLAFSFLFFVDLYVCWTWIVGGFDFGFSFVFNLFYFCFGLCGRLYTFGSFKCCRSHTVWFQMNVAAAHRTAPHIHIESNENIFNAIIFVFFLSFKGI